MNLYVLDRELNIISIIDSFESCIWNVSYFEYGDFELYIPATIENVKTLQREHYIVRDIDIIDGKLYDAMVIESIGIKTDVSNGNYLTVKGRCLKSLLSRRIIWTQTNVSGTVESCMRTLIAENAINPTDTDRTIPKLRLGEIKGYTETLSKQLTGVNLGEAIIDICTTYGIGWRVYIDKDKSLIIDFHKGKDLSDNQSDNPRITFSTEFDTLLNSDYNLNTQNYKNIALVAGEGEGTARKTVTVGSAMGLDRYELYVDARDQSTNDGEISTSEYYSQLSEKGTESLEVAAYTESFEGEIETLSNFQYGADYNIGDIVNVENEYGITATPRIIGVIKSVSNSGESIIPTFSTWKGEN